MPTLPITYPTGKKLAATFTDQSSGQVWRISTSALETFVVANVADYGVVPSESPASSGRYPVATPTDLPTGWYKVDIYLIAGSSLASGDLGSWIGDELGYFDGTKFITATVAPTVVQIREEMDANSTKLANLDAAVSTRSVYAGEAVASVTAPVTVGTVNDKAGYSLTTDYDAAKDAAPVGSAMALTSGERSDIVEAVFAKVVEGTTTFIQAVRGWSSALMAKCSGLDPDGTPKYRDLGDLKDRITASVDEYGNRSSVTRDLD